MSEPRVRAPAVRADRDKLRQVLLNLLSNAVKFTPAGSRVWVETVGTGGASSNGASSDGASSNGAGDCAPGDGVPGDGARGARGRTDVVYLRVRSEGGAGSAFTLTLPGA